MCLLRSLDIKYIPNICCVTEKLTLLSMLQSGLGTHDLGQFYYKPLKEPSGSTILVTVNNVTDPKAVTFGSAKWIPVSKLQRRQSASLLELSEAQDCLVTSFSVSFYCMREGIFAFSKNIFKAN